jgi:hypothetical protein
MHLPDGAATRRLGRRVTSRPGRFLPNQTSAERPCEGSRRDSYPALDEEVYPWSTPTS